jgi:serine/threonine-protein kinase RsbW
MNARCTAEAILRLGNEPQALHKLASFVQDFVLQAGINKESGFALDLALTEWITNILEHGFNSSAPELGLIEVHLSLIDTVIRAEVVDNGPAFNPFEYPAVQTDTPLEEKPIGGLGIHLIRKFMDEVFYERQTNRNRLVLIKKPCT